MLLAPYRVLDLSDERGQLCGQILADLGADVVIAEPPGGSSARRIGPFRSNGTGAAPGVEDSLFWWAYNRNKRGITVDLETEAGRERFRRLVRSADVLIESFTPGYLDRLGLGYHDLSALNPRLVMVSITPFGQDGPKAAWAATDLTALAASHTLLLSGDDDRPPVRLSLPQAFLHASAEGAVGALIALAARERDGRGQHVDASAQAATTMATQSMVLQAGWGEQVLGRVAGGLKLGPIRLRFIYPCKDGHVSVTFLFGTAIGPFSRRLMEWMHEEGFVDAATRDKDWLNYGTLLITGQEPLSELERCITAIERFTLSKTKEELFREALRRGLLIVPVSTTADLLRSEQLTARAYWTPVSHEGLEKPVLYPGPFARFSATPIRYRRPAPRLGEHDEEVDREWTTMPAPTPAATLHGNGTPRLPLAGVKVLDFTWVMVGPIGVRYLADYGATVVHVESSTRIDTARTLQPFKNGQPGPERSGLYANVNAGKLGLTLNLSTPEGRGVALKLAAWADVVVESYSPKAMRAWGLDYESLRAVNPRLIMMSSCLNGQTGPHALLAGFGTMGAALAGFVELAGWPDRPPAGPFGAYTDYVAPKFIAAALLAALDHRRRTGEGQYIDLSQAEASIHFLTPAVLDYTVNGRVQTRMGNRSLTEAPHGVYPCAGEDRWVAIACADEAQWRALCAVSGHPEWAVDPRFATLADRIAHADALDALVAAWTAPRDVEEVERLLQGAGVPVHRVATSADCFADPQLAHRGHFVTLEHPELGPVPVENSRLRLSRTPARIAWPGPTYGQHNDQVLREILGLSDADIVRLVTAGALE
jgi:crotonobetainyl-CoA:carnitine CoA-transferase CaiB-like acyl-CoA transferase